MSTRKIASAAFTGAAAAATLGLTAPPANAAPASAWHITPGNSTGMTMTNTNELVFVDRTTGATMTCPTARMAGHLSGDGKTSASAQLATISTAVLGASCSLAGIPVQWKLKRPVTLWGSHYAGGITRGHLGNGTASDFSASISANTGFGCHTRVGGATIPVTYVNASHELHVNSDQAPTLAVRSAQGCLGLLNTGDSAYFTVDFSVNPPATISYGA